MEREKVKWHKYNLDTWHEYTIPDLLKAIDELVQQAHKDFEIWVENGDTSVVGRIGSKLVEFKIHVGSDDDYPEFDLIPYRTESDKEYEARMHRVNTAKKAARKASETKKKKQEEELRKQAALWADPEYVKFVELQKKYGQG